jgi:LysR family transcriptional regulator for metE and metH
VQRIADIPAPQLEVRDFRLMLALAAAGSTTHAASSLHLTQSAVSRALLSIEERLGAALFERTSRGLTPTPAGKRLLAGAARLLVEVKELERLVLEVPEARELRVVCECYTAYHWLPSAIGALKDALPDLKVNLAVEFTEDPAQALTSGKVDVALMTSRTVSHGLIQVQPLFADEIVFVLSRTHPLASRKALTRADLEGATLLASTRAAPHEAKWFVSQVCGKAKPKLRFERLPLTEAIIDVARAGLGVAVLSEWIAEPHLKDGTLVAKRMVQGPLLRPWTLAWRKEHRDAAERLGTALATTAPHPARGLF